MKRPRATPITSTVGKSRASKAAGAAAAPSHPIDRIMEQASEALIATDYFKAEQLGTRALAMAVSRGDYERLARVCLPLQEARRQIRQLAVDACITGRITGLIDKPSAEIIEPGCYLAQPPLIAMDAKRIRQQAWSRGLPVFILTREPTTRDGLWPIAAVGTGEFIVTARIKVNPPALGSASDLPDIRWFQATHEALGDAAIAKAPPNDPPAWRVLDLLEYADAVPEHEKIHQALAVESRRAMTAPMPKIPRRRGPGIDPFGF